jgi:hypothetical protein
LRFHRGGTLAYSSFESMGDQRYVSKELSHFVGRNLSERDDQFELLVKILSDGWLTHPPHNPALGTALATNPTGRTSTNDVFVEHFVCFCDIPEADLGLHIQKYSPFGLAFRKEFLIAKGANPVLYVANHSRIRVPADLSRPGAILAQLQRELESPLEAATEEATRARHFDEMVEETFTFFRELEGHWLGPFVNGAVNSPADLPEFLHLERLIRVRRFLLFYVLSYLKAFDDSKPDGDPDNFYMEREWRVVGNVRFELSDVARIFLPATYGRQFRERCPKYFGQITFV